MKLAEKLAGKPGQRNGKRTEISAAILCGGESKRLGRAKEFLPYGGKTLIEHCLDLFSGQFQDLVLVSNRPDDFAHLTAHLVKDIVPNRGPLVAVLSALLVSETEQVFVCACDLPYIDEQLIELICSESSRLQANLTVYKHDSQIEPLLGVYSKALIPAFEEALVQGKDLDSDFVQSLAPNYFVDLRVYREGRHPGRSIDTPRDYGMLLLR